jgi:hypothetical protein
MDVAILNQLKKLFPKESPSAILRLLAEERLAAERNAKSLHAARKALAGKKSDRDLL